MCPGQFIGLIAKRCSSSSGIRNMLSAELLPVAGGDPESLLVDERRFHLEVAAPCVLPAAQFLERVEDRHPLRVPERRPRRVLVEVEEVELRAQPPVVAPLRLLQPLEVGVEIGLRVERCPVDARQLRVVLVAAPVRAREARELDRLDRLRVLQVRAAAEVGELTLRVEWRSGPPPFRRARPCTARPQPRTACAPPRRKPPPSSTRDLPRAPA